jgi:hypothetical protein
MLDSLPEEGSVVSDIAGRLEGDSFESFSALNTASASPEMKGVALPSFSVLSSDSPPKAPFVPPVASPFVRGATIDLQVCNTE